MALTKRGAARGDKSTCLGNTSNHTEKLTYSLCDVRNCGRCEEMKRPAKNRNYANRKEKRLMFIIEKSQHVLTSLRRAALVRKQE